jgi:hypothetical protein
MTEALRAAEASSISGSGSASEPAFLQVSDHMPHDVVNLPLSVKTQLSASVHVAMQRCHC